MNIIREDIDELNAVIKIQFTPEEYLPTVDNVLKQHQKKIVLPGFRQGKIPMSMLRKMHGKSILIEELNKIIPDSLTKYFSENKIRLLGTPFPDANSSFTDDFENLRDIVFSYNIGLAPSVEVHIPKEEPLDYYMLSVDDKVIDRHISVMQDMMGKYTTSESTEDNDFVTVDIQELDEYGNIKENGIRNTTFLSINMIKDAEIKSSFISRKKEDVIIADMNKLTGNNKTELSSILNIIKEKADNLQNNFQLTIKAINRKEKVEINQELFDKIVGTGAVNNVEDFREKVKEAIILKNREISERKFISDIINKMLDSHFIPLPEELLKKTLLHSNEKIQLTDEDVNNRYSQFAQNIKWNLIVDKIIKDNEISINQNEIEEAVKRDIVYDAYQSGKTLSEQIIEEKVQYFMKNENALSPIISSVFENKVIIFLKSVFEKNIKELSEEEFYKATSEKGVSNSQMQL